MTQEYIGTKQVTAWPQDQDGEPGYAVKYTDGYTSWSPKATFEAAYRPIGHVSHLPPHVQRVIGEAAQLTQRLAKLRAFLRSDDSAGLPAAERAQLERQHEAMGVYHEVLTERMDDFGTPGAVVPERQQG